MTTASTLPAGIHTEAGSLAWYVAGKLRDGEHERITAHLQSCEQCRAELQAIEQLRQDLRESWSAGPGPSQHTRAAVMAQIRRSTVQDVPSGLPSGFLARLGHWLRAPAMPRWTTAAALTLVLAQTGLLMRNGSPTAEPSAPVVSRSLPVQSGRLGLRFNPQATEAQIRELLQILNARIVDGPDASGVFVVELAAADPTTTARRIATARARQDILQSIDLATP